MKKSILFIYIFFILLEAVESQVPMKWYFGQKAAIDFGAAATPIPFLGSLMNTPAGCAVSYNHEYYSNGQTIWNSQGILNNGTGLNGNMLSTQSVAIVKTLKADTFYVFTTDQGGGNKGLNFHIISKPKQGGYQVVHKNDKLLNNVSEKLAIGLHCNKTDYWVLTHGWNENKYYAYLVDTVKLNSQPVISQIGSIHGGQSTNAAGYLKFSRQVDRVASAITGQGVVELFKFDNISGQLYDLITINNVPHAYGVEFDQSGHVLYVSSITGTLYQFDISQWNQADINSSKSILTTDIALFGALQRGPDNRIYLSIDNSNYLAAILSPSTLGVGASYIQNYVFLNSAKCEAGLPQIFESTKLFDVKGVKSCIGDTSFFEILGDTTRIDSVFWSFGDSLSNMDTSTLFSPYYIYPKRGTYQFKLIIYHCNQADTLKNYVEVLGPPYAYLGPDTSICANSNFELFPGYATSYIWHDSSTTKTYLVLDTGLYYVELTNKCGKHSDTLRIKEVFQPPVFKLPSDTILCVGDSIELNSPFGSGFFSIWQDTLLAQSLMVLNSGLYNLEIIDSNSCRFKDDILVQFDPIPSPNLGNDTTICFNQSITFNGNFPGNYYWSEGSNQADLTTYSAGLYIVTVTNGCGSGTDSVNLSIADCEHIIWVPNAFTPNQDGDNDMFLPYVENVDNYKFSVFDRWGNLMFFTENTNHGWDGMVNGKIQPIGVYVWRMDFADFYNNKYTKHGFVVILK